METRGPAPTTPAAPRLQPPLYRQHSLQYLGGLLNFWDVEFARDNGAGGKLPVLPLEWKAVGLASDTSCFKLLEYLYRTHWVT